MFFFTLTVYVFCNVLLANIFSVPPLISWIESRTDQEKQPILPFFYWLPFDPFVGYRYEIMFVLQMFHCKYYYFKFNFQNKMNN